MRQCTGAARQASQADVAVPASGHIGLLHAAGQTWPVYQVYMPVWAGVPELVQCKHEQC